MRVLLVQSNLGDKRMMPVYPLGLAYIGTSLLEHGHETRIVDPNIAADPMRSLERELKDYCPDLVGISLRNIDNQARLNQFYSYKFFQHTLDKIRQWNGEIPIVVGGAGFSMFPKRIMQDNPALDFGVYLEGEDSFPGLLNNLNSPSTVNGIYHRKDQNICFTGNAPLPDFRNLPFPRRDFHDIAPYLTYPQSIGVQTKRGCPLKCAYCNYPFLNGKNWRLRTPEHICDELEYLLEEVGVNVICFADSILNLPYSHSVEIFEGIVQRGLPVKWYAYMSLKKITPDYIDLAIASGCRSMLFSPDAYSQEALDGMEKEISTEEIDKSLAMFSSQHNPKWRDLEVGYCFFLGGVGESVPGYLKAIWFFLKWSVIHIYNKNVFIIPPNWIRIEPETKVHQVALQEGVIAINTDLLPDSTKELAKTFYVAPKVKFIDDIVFRLLVVARILRRLILSTLHKLANIINR